MKILSSTLLAALALTLASCASYDTAGYGRQYTPAVAMPSDLNQNEDRYIDQVGDVLTSAGYRLSNSRSAEYSLEFSIEDGPVNADTTITLLRNGSEVATSYSRSGGPRIILQRQQVVRESFDKALSDFSRRVPSVGGGYNSGYDDYSRGGYNRSRNYDDGYYDRGGSSSYRY